MKLPPREDGSLLVRDEHVFAGSARRVPEAAADMLRAYVRGEPLAPVVRLQTIRRTVALTDELGRPVAQVVDDEVSVMDGRHVASRFREVEVELDPAAPAEVAEGLLARLGRRRRRTGRERPEGAARARASSGPAARRRRARPLVRPPWSTSVVRGALASSVIRLIRHDAGVRIGDDPEDVHQARVASRRLRSDLRTFRDVLEPAFASSLRDELRWLGGELGAVRDAEVLRDRLRGRAESSLPATDRRAAERLLARLDERRDATRAALLAAMDGARYVELLDRLVAASGDPAVLPEVAGMGAAEALRPALASPWKHLRGATEAARADPADEMLHAARIRAKRARYAAEALAPVFGKRARQFADAAADLQDVLGEHQDAVVAGAWLRDAAAGPAGQAFVAGELAALEAAAARAARDAWPGAWKAVSRKRLRFWA